MPRYNIRRHYIYVDEYHVDADSAQEADELVDRWEANNPITGVESICQRECDDYESTWAVEIDENGFQLADVEEL